MKALTKHSHGVDKHCRCCGAGRRRLWKKSERRTVRRKQRVVDNLSDTL